MMKKIIFIILIISILFLVSCTNLDDYIPIDEYEQLQSDYNDLKADHDNVGIDNDNLNIEIDDLNKDLDSAKEENEKYKELLNNLNDLLSNVYYGYASNSNYISKGFNIFSMEYGDKIFLITAGHCTHYNFEGLDTGLYTTIKIKNNNGDWIYPKLLTYENDFADNKDYAILYSDKVKSGLDFDLDNSYPEYILGNEDSSIIKQFNIYDLIEGESGSPVIDLDGEVIGIATGSFVDIDIVLEAIDDLE